jgi:hypothetical protein
MLPSFPLVVRGFDGQTNSVLGQDLDAGRWYASTVSPEHETESHDDGEPVESGCGVEVVPGRQQLVAVEIEECAEEDGSEDVCVLEGGRIRCKREA